MSWAFLLAVGLLWLAVALTVGALVGHGISCGSDSASEPPEAETPRSFAEQERFSA